MAGKKRNKIRITFNAPVTLCFALVCALVLAVDYLTKGRAVQTVFSSGGGKACAVPFDFSSLFSYLKLFQIYFTESFHLFSPSFSSCLTPLRRAVPQFSLKVPYTLSPDHRYLPPFSP